MREFESFTDDLLRMADWLLACGITTVVMESTGIFYWIPVFKILEDKGLDVKLVNARHVKNVPGCKSDVLEPMAATVAHLWSAYRHFPLNRGLCPPPCLPTFGSG